MDMQKLTIQIDSSVNDDFQWLANAIPQYLIPFNLQAVVMVNPKVAPNPSGPLNNAQIFNFAQNNIDHSGLRQKADELEEWYVNVFITTEHVELQ